jgi:hypothetical protein
VRPGGFAQPARFVRPIGFSPRPGFARFHHRRFPGRAFIAGAALGYAASPYWGYGYDYGYADDCPLVRVVTWTPYGYRRTWVSSCDY